MTAEVFISAEIFVPELVPETGQNTLYQLKCNGRYSVYFVLFCLLFNAKSTESRTSSRWHF